MISNVSGVLNTFIILGSTTNRSYQRSYQACSSWSLCSTSKFTIDSNQIIIHFKTKNVIFALHSHTKLSSKFKYQSNVKSLYMLINNNNIMAKSKIIMVPNHKPLQLSQKQVMVFHNLLQLDQPKTAMIIQCHIKKIHKRLDFIVLSDFFTKKKEIFISVIICWIYYG